MEETLIFALSTMLWTLKIKKLFVAPPRVCVPDLNIRKYKNNHLPNKSSVKSWIEFS